MNLQEQRITNGILEIGFGIVKLKAENASLKQENKRLIKLVEALTPSKIISI